MIIRKIIILFVTMLLFTGLTLNVSSINIETLDTDNQEEGDFENYERWHHIVNDEEFIESKEHTNNKNLIPGEILVQFKEKIYYSHSPENQILTGIPSIDSLNEQFGVHNFKEVFSENTIPELENIYLLNCSIKVNPKTIASIYNDDPNVEIAEPNYIYEYHSKPNDPRFSKQWALYQFNDIDIDATES